MQKEFVILSYLLSIYIFLLFSGKFCTFETQKLPALEERVNSRKHKNPEGY